MKKVICLVLAVMMVLGLAACGSGGGSKDRLEKIKEKGVLEFCTEPYFAPMEFIDPSQSDGYNPFAYIRNEKDVLTLIDNLIKNTTPRNAASNDPFWESATRSLTVRSQRTNNKICCLDNW